MLIEKYLFWVFRDFVSQSVTSRVSESIHLIIRYICRWHYKNLDLIPHLQRNSLLKLLSCPLGCKRSIDSMKWKVSSKWKVILFFHKVIWKSTPPTNISSPFAPRSAWAPPKINEMSKITSHGGDRHIGYFHIVTRI